MGFRTHRVNVDIHSVHQGTVGLAVVLDVPDLGVILSKSGLVLGLLGKLPSNFMGPGSSVGLND